MYQEHLKETTPEAAAVDVVAATEAAVTVVDQAADQAKCVVELEDLITVNSTSEAIHVVDAEVAVTEAVDQVAVVTVAVVQVAVAIVVVVAVIVEVVAEAVAVVVEEAVVEIAVDAVEAVVVEEEEEVDDSKFTELLEFNSILT